MKNLIMIMVSAFLIGCFANKNTITGKKPEGTILVFTGTVIDIQVSPLRQSTLNWVVTMRVDQISQGEFSGSQFSFRIHSPTQSGLIMGQTYRVEAKRTSEGYTVDQNQWTKQIAPSQPVERTR
jgi:hypothetical protein